MTVRKGKGQPSQRSSAEVYAELMEKAVAIAKALLALKCAHPVSGVGLFGSLADALITGRRYKVHDGSDIDLVVFLERWDELAERLARRYAANQCSLYKVHTHFEAVLSLLGVAIETRWDLLGLAGGVKVDVVIMPHPDTILEDYDGLYYFVHFCTACGGPHFPAEMARYFALFDSVAEGFRQAEAPWAFHNTHFAPDDADEGVFSPESDWEDIPDEQSLWVEKVPLRFKHFLEQD